jgi:NAD(P)-dependent dehydrogenase (short-subunit alcohol dehydrogenase family)
MTCNQFDLSDRCAVVIGGTSGIGRAIALGLAQAGANVAPTSRRQLEVDKTATDIEGLGVRSLRICSDVLDRASLVSLHDQVLRYFGRLDILVNSAGITRRVPTLDCSESDWARVMETNLPGTFRACQIFGKTMVKQQSGKIINIASLSTFVGFHEVAAYGASKAGVGLLTKTLAVELSCHGVSVNAIAPGIFRTDLNEDMLRNTPRGTESLMRTPIKRFGNVNELTGAAVFLASDASAYVAGEILVVDGGFLASGVNQ